jgi:hypothetical protein
MRSFSHLPPEMITADIIRSRRGGHTLITRYGNAFNVLKTFYPNVHIDKKLGFHQFKTQHYLTHMLREILPGYMLEANYKHPDLWFTNYCIIASTIVMILQIRSNGIGHLFPFPSASV